MEHGEERALLIMPYPYYEFFYEAVRRKPKSKLFFITIKDNTQSTKWITIGKVNDWVRKYADEYIITRGKVGGIHFHLICYANKNTNFKIPKGIHLKISPIGKKSFDCPTSDEIQDILKAKHFQNEQTKNTIKRLKVPLVSLSISAIIRAHFTKQENRVKRIETRNKQEENIQRVLNYLHKNLLENPPEEILKYLSWVEK